MDPDPAGAPERDEADRALHAVVLGALLGVALSLLARRPVRSAT
jgi:hypothetical protein